MCKQICFGNGCNVQRALKGETVSAYTQLGPPHGTVVLDGGAVVVKRRRALPPQLQSDFTPLPHRRSSGGKHHGIACPRAVVPSVRGAHYMP